MKKIAVLGANEAINKLILKAKKRGIETHVFSWDINEIGATNADLFYKISVDNKDEILRICEIVQPDGIISITTDFAVPTINYVARKLSLIGNSELTDVLARNKFAMRNAFLKAGLYVPFFKLVSSLEELNELEYPYPLVVKPTDRWSSKGVSIVESNYQLRKAVSNALNISLENKAIIEGYIQGKEYSAECLSFNREHSILAITRKITSGRPHFVEIGHIQPAELDQSSKSRIETEIFKALDSLDIKFGASHVEFKITENDDIAIIEIGARMGGDCIGTDLVYLSTGLDYIDFVIDVSFGIKPDITEKRLNQFSIVKYIVNISDLKSLEILKEKYPSNVVYISHLSEVSEIELNDSSQRFGYYLLSGKLTDKNLLQDIIEICGFGDSSYD
jgi:biotin carboxylase